MIPSEYNINKQLNDYTKYNIQFDRNQILNKVCADYIYDILQYSAEFAVPYETQYKLLGMIENILGHKVDYILASDQDRSRIYFGNVPSNFELTIDSIKQLQTDINEARGFEYTTNLDDELFIYAYPKYYGEVDVIYDQNSFDITGAFNKSEIKVNSIDYLVYTLKDPSFVNNYKILFT